MTKKASSTPDFGNWVSNRLIYIFAVLGLALLAVAFLVWVAVIPAIVFLCDGSCILLMHAICFRPRAGTFKTKFGKQSITNLNWDGEGKALDIGCGNGALTIKLAQKFAAAHVTGVDFWGERWEYSKGTCEANAKAAGVGEQNGFSEGKRV